MGSPHEVGHQSRWSLWKQTLTIHQILHAAGFLARLRNRGGRLVGACPLHGGDNPTAFTVDREGRRWNCFTRCRGGDLIKLAWHLCDRSWPRTARWLEQFAGSMVPCPADQPALAQPRTVPDRPQVFRPFMRSLPLDPAPPHLVRLGLREATVREFEAGAWHGAGFLQGTVAVRLHDLDGSPLGYAGRILDPDRAAREGRWRWPPRYPKSQLIYNWHRVRSHRTSGLIVVEGFWSVMKLAQAGYRNVVALGGVGVTEQHVALLATAARVILMLDGDVVGAAASNQLVAQRIHPRLQAIRLPEGQDPAELPEERLIRILTPIIRASPQQR